MPNLYIGCSGWSYTAWQGPFYPRGLEQTKWLSHYSTIFDFVEVDSTFYSIPSLFRVRKWAANTPAGFRFTAKMPKAITHEKVFVNIDRELEYFYSSLSPLKEKTLCFLIQMPPYLSFKTGLRPLRNFVSILDRKYRYAVEARQVTWLNDEFYSFLKENNICLVWNQLDAIRVPPMVTTDFVYLRFIGDRSIQEHEFGKIQKDRTKEMEQWASELNKVIDGLSFGVVAQNNHYAGFGPGSVNIFRRILGLPELQFAGEKNQSRLTEFGT